jgi:hypothetical protein
LLDELEAARDARLQADEVEAARDAVVFACVGVGVGERRAVRAAAAQDAMAADDVFRFFGIVAAGVALKQEDGVFRKAIFICLECIGIG